MYGAFLEAVTFSFDLATACCRLLRGFLRGGFEDDEIPRGALVWDTLEFGSEDSWSRTHFRPGVDGFFVS